MCCPIGLNESENATRNANTILSLPGRGVNRLDGWCPISQMIHSRVETASRSAGQDRLSPPDQ